MNAPTVIPVTTAAHAVAIAVGAGLTVYTHSIDLSNLDTFALSYSLACTGVPNARIQIQQSVVLPVTEGAADTNFVVPETVPDVVAALITKTVHIQGLFPVCTRYIRFMITKVTGVVVDTIMTMNVSAQNRFVQ